MATTTEQPTNDGSANTFRGSLTLPIAFAALTVALLALVVSIRSGGAESQSPNPDALTGPEPALMADANHEEAAHAATSATKVESYQRPNPALPAVPAGRVKRFSVDVSEHVTRVSPSKPPLRVWSYGVDGKFLSGTGGSPPMVVNEGDPVEIDFVNGSSKAMAVHFKHSIDFHSSELAPNVSFADVEPGGRKRLRFVAKHAGVFMYHCGSKPVLRHVGAGMSGMMIVRPRRIAPVDRELWMTQQEFYLGKPKEDANVKKMVAKTPDVIAFNGFASQYFSKPIAVKRGERIRVWLLNAGPSLPSYFHVIGTVFDKAVIEGSVFRSAQTVNVGPAQGGYVEFTLDREGRYPFVTHAFGDMVRGAVGVFQTADATPEAPAPAHDDKTMGGMDMGATTH